MTHEIRLLGHADAAVLEDVADQVFDEVVNPAWAREFLADPRHHIVVALDGATVIGFASAVHYIHPDKPPELWINEVGVAPPYHRRGIGRQLLGALLAHGRSLGCAQAWVLTEEDNEPARGLYEATGGVEEACIMYTFSLQAEAQGSHSPYPR
ncbi:MAG TPA: GNAT family N-acetyltransferase [Gemmatimonadaceae bacterium]|jgi:ribosomal protein S18 acetylase RimI-like enzyme|nr:GNAT family N-acetyltransferase [Gemmatimonadaceae bacterium]